MSVRLEVPFGGSSRRPGSIRQVWGISSTLCRSLSITPSSRRVRSEHLSGEFPLNSYLPSERLEVLGFLSHPPGEIQNHPPPPPRPFQNTPKEPCPRFTGFSCGSGWVPIKNRSNSAHGVASCHPCSRLETREVKAAMGSKCGSGSKPMVPFWSWCTTHFSLFLWDWDVHGTGFRPHGHVRLGFAGCAIFLGAFNLVLEGVWRLMFLWIFENRCFLPKGPGIKQKREAPPLFGSKCGLHSPTHAEPDAVASKEMTVSGCACDFYPLDLWSRHHGVAEQPLQIGSHDVLG